MESKTNNKNVLSLHCFFRTFYGYNYTKQDTLRYLKVILQKSSVAENDNDSSMDYIVFKNGSDKFKLKCNTSTDKRSNNFMNSEDDKSTNKRTESDHIREVIYTKFCKDNFTAIQKISDYFERYKYFTLSPDSYKFIDDFCKNVFNNEENTREFINFITGLDNDYLKSAWIFAFLCFPKNPSAKNTDYRLMLLKQLLQSQHTKKDFHPLDITDNDKQIEKVNNDNIGRSEEIGEIKREMLSNNTVLVYGIGGIGKSYICRKLFWNYYDSFSDGIEYLAWIQYNGNLEQSITSSFYEAETNLDSIRKKYDNHPVIGDMFVKLALSDKPEDKMQVIKEHFNKLNNRLLVFIDNADTMTKDEKKWLNSCKCRMIITSRQKIDGFHNVNINSPSPEYCKEMYIREIWENSRDTYSLNDEKYINKITELANYHTQTVMLIAKAQICLGLSSEEMLEELNNTGFVLKGYDEIIDTEDYELTMAEHLTKIFNLLNVSDEAQLRTIRLFSLLATNTPVKKRDIKKWFGLNSLTSINELVKYGWLNSSGSEYVSIHPVIADVVRYNYKPDFEYALPLINALQEEMKAADDYIKKDAIIVHCSSVATIFDDVEEESYADFLCDIGSIFHNLSSYSCAVNFYQKALSIRKNILGTEHPDTAKLYNNLAVVFSEQGRYNEALELFNKTISLQEKYLVRDNADSATTYNNIGENYFYQGDYIKALEFFYKSLSIRKTIGEENHLDTIIVYNNIAVTVSAQGSYDKALEYYNKILAIQEKTVGKDHPNTAHTYNNIAVTIYKQKDYNKALEYFNKALAIREVIYGEKNPYTATSYCNIGLLYYTIGEYSEAEKYIKKALEIRKIILGLDHPDTALNYNNIGQLYMAQRRYSEAIKNIKIALETQEKIFGARHIYTVESYILIGEWNTYQGNYSEAINYYNVALAIQEKNLGLNHPDTIKTKNKIEDLFSEKE